jgi:hypothetical protein
MLKLLRKNTKTIVWAVVLSFALWGAYSVGTQFQKEGRVAGVVFGKEVSFQEFNRFYRASEIFTISGQRNDDASVLRQQTWQNIVYSREAQQKKIEVSDEEVRSEIGRLLSAQKIENPTAEFYEGWVRSALRETPQEFESQVRELLRIQKLIQQVREKNPAPAVPEEAALQRFRFEQNKLSAEIMTFPSKPEAESFKEKVKDGKTWEKETQGKTKASGMTAVRNLIAIWGIAENDALELMKLEKGAISGVLPNGPQFAVVRLLEKEPADESKFDKETQEKYLDEMQEQERFQGFMSWNMEVYSRAQLKDYLPPLEKMQPDPAPIPEAPAEAPKP